MTSGVRTTTEAVDANVGPPRLAVTGLSKRYPGVQALDTLDLSLRSGEVRALLGKNGAGKSTLVRILSGAEAPDSGQILIDGQAVVIDSPARARELGIATVHQELSLVPELNVAENLLLGRWATAGTFGPLLRPYEMIEFARQHLERLELNIDPRAKISSLSVAARQHVEIARAVSLGSQVLILDEPTSSLPAAEVTALLALVRRLAGSGISVVYVSHRMDEIPVVADSVTVVRDGRLVETRQVGDADTGEIVRLMTGGAIHTHRVTSAGRSTDIVLDVKNLRSRDRLIGVDLRLHRGEVLGIAGLLGSGRSELLRCLFGLDPVDHGTIEAFGHSRVARSPRAAIRAGIGFTPEERKRDGIVLGMGVSANLVMTVLKRLSRFGLLSARGERSIARISCGRLAIKTPSVHTEAGKLSGGNQQKIILGKWLNAGARILLLDEPTRGVDVEAKDQIYGLIRELAVEGTSTVLVSSEIEELFLVCDRIIVLHGGRVVADLPTEETTASDVLALAMKGTP